MFTVKHVPCMFFFSTLTGIGWGMFLVSCLIAVYYNMIIGWTLFYLFASFNKDVPWRHCENDWNSPRKLNFKKLNVKLVIIVQGACQTRKELLVVCTHSRQPFCGCRSHNRVGIGVSCTVKPVVYSHCFRRPLSSKATL